MEKLVRIIIGVSALGLILGLVFGPAITVIVGISILFLLPLLSLDAPLAHIKDFKAVYSATPKGTVLVSNRHTPKGKDAPESERQTTSPEWRYVAMIISASAVMICIGLYWMRIGRM